MKRTKVLRAGDADHKIMVTVAIDSSGLTKNESLNQIETLASRIMESLANTPYLAVHLSQIRVTR